MDLEHWLREIVRRLAGFTATSDGRGAMFLICGLWSAMNTFFIIVLKTQIDPLERLVNRVKVKLSLWCDESR